MSKKDFSDIDLKKFHHATPIQIRFSDIDRMGHVNNATFLTYCETARIAYMNELLGKEHDWLGHGVILAHCEIDYIQPIYQQDNIVVRTRTTKVGTKSFTVENILMRVEGDREVLCAHSTAVLVCMNYDEKKTVEVPEEWKNKVKKFERW